MAARALYHRGQGAGIDDSGSRSRVSPGRCSGSRAEDERFETEKDHARLRFPLLEKAADVRPTP